MQGIKYYIPKPDYYHTNKQPKQYQKQQNQNIYLPPSPSIEDIHTWYSRGRGKARHLDCMVTDCMVKRQGHCKANQRENIRKISICENVEQLVPNLC